MNMDHNSITGLQIESLRLPQPLQIEPRNSSRKINGLLWNISEFERICGWLPLDRTNRASLDGLITLLLQQHKAGICPSYKHRLDSTGVLNDIQLKLLKVGWRGDDRQDEHEKLTDNFRYRLHNSILSLPNIVC